MIFLIFGLVLFLGMHLTQTLAPGWYAQKRVAWGEGQWKGLYSAVSIIGFVLLIYGYGLARQETSQIYLRFDWARTALLLVMPIAFVLFVTSQLPAGYIKRAVGHPQLIGVAFWSFFHLLANGDVASVLLFGGFLVWSLLNLRSCYSRPSNPPAKTVLWSDAVSLVAGLVLTYFFISYAHEAWIGVSAT